MRTMTSTDREWVWRIGWGWVDRPVEAPVEVPAVEDEDDERESAAA